MINDTDYPEVTTRKAMLERARDNFRMEGYEGIIKLESMKCQDFGVKDDVKIPLKEDNGQVSYTTKRDLLANLQKQSENAFKSARKMQELLDELPEEPKEE